MIDQGAGVPQDAVPILRQHFRQTLLPGVFDEADNEELKANREQVAVDIMRLAKNRRDELTHAAREGDA